jgi:phosphate transport system substrate-binding protein
MKSKFQKLMVGLTSAVVLLGASASYATDILGVGATFPAPLYAKWAEAYKAKTGLKVEYHGIGSGSGIKHIINKTVDFAASDMPLKPEELDKAGLIQFPVLVGGVVPVINVPEIEQGTLKLTGDVLADIFLGEITKWNDPAIVALNLGMQLPDEAITVVHRSEASGTSFIFTNYLSKVSDEWKKDVGEGMTVAWKANQTSARGNEGVGLAVQRTKGAIGYVEYTYALKNKLDFVQLKNRSGQYVKPDDISLKAAAALAQWEKAPTFYKILTDEAGKACWPITGATFVLMYKTQEKPDSAAEVLKFFDWAYQNGDDLAIEQGFVPLPANLVAQVQTAWKKQIKDPSGKALWK